MKQIKFLGVVALALSLGLAACNGGGNSKGSSKHTHTWGDYAQVKAATCTEKGSEKRVCSGCQQEQTRDIPALGHQFLEGDADVKTDVVAATCEEAGSYKHECQRCHQPIQETVAALGHDWEDAADQSEAIAPTCTEAGTKIQVCKNNPAHKQEVEVEALGHDFSNPHKLDIPGPTETNTKGEIPFQWAEITNYSCSRGDSYRYAWSAKEVNFDYANEGVHWTQEEIDAAVEGDPAYGKTTDDWKTEPKDGVDPVVRPVFIQFQSEGNAYYGPTGHSGSSANDPAEYPITYQLYAKQVGSEIHAFVKIDVSFMGSVDATVFNTHMNLLDKSQENCVMGEFTNEAVALPGGTMELVIFSNPNGANNAANAYGNLAFKVQAKTAA